MAGDLAIEIGGSVGGDGFECQVGIDQEWRDVLGGGIGGGGAVGGVVDGGSGGGVGEGDDDGAVLSGGSGDGGCGYGLLRGNAVDGPTASAATGDDDETEGSEGGSGAEMGKRISERLGLRERGNFHCATPIFRWMPAGEIEPRPIRHSLYCFRGAAGKRKPHCGYASGKLAQCRAPSGA